MKVNVEATESRLTVIVKERHIQLRWLGQARAHKLIDDEDVSTRSRGIVYLRCNV